MRNNRVQALVEVALAVALAAVLNFISLRLPINFAGGSISLTMLPIAIVALRRGPAAGAFAGAIFGTIDLLMEPYIVFWAQVVLDYPLPYLLFGLGCGAFSGLYARVSQGLANKQASQAGDKSAAPTTSPAHPHLHLISGSAVVVVALLVGGVLRFATHVASGVIFFAADAAGQNVWLYSIVYNLSYVAPSLLLSLVFTLLLLPVLERAVPRRRVLAH
jgi:thiamine transporter